ncbi:acyl-CoA/acyl-ACP dehydrogenase [Rhizobium sp. SEMIA 4085]|uniref:acyl-CoA dehydrogenase family protein n=1 Tax=Rhizobium sp. SEMIA 4085 TaxID=2137761 RepID=UPI00147819EB|nr:acyl-CoA/acyl-ACP dehydrogenase [Rhizobium sp. SEMIA 4085]
MRAGGVAAFAGNLPEEAGAEALFRREAGDAWGAEGLRSTKIPADLGGEGASITEIADLCSILGQTCAASAMVFAMHQIKLSSLVEHGAGSDWHRDYMRHVAKEQLLLASATTEGGIGGNLRNSICAIKVVDGTCFLEKDATVISYGAHADAVLITSRSHTEAASSDQVLTVFLKGQYRLERTVEWNTLGMRGTCSDGFLFKGEGPAAQILPKPFAEIAAESMLATSHLLWSGVWYGIAADAVARAQAFVRAAARKSPGTPPPGALRLAEVSCLLQMVKSNVLAGLKIYEEAKADADRLSSMAFAVAMNNVKIASSEMILPIINHAMLICGIMGYKNGTPYSLGRHLRDAHSAQLMISNDRILGNTSPMLLVHKQGTSLLG